MVDVIDDFTDERYAAYVEEYGEPSSPVVLRAELRDEVIREMTDIRTKTDSLHSKPSSSSRTLLWLMLDMSALGLTVVRYQPKAVIPTHRTANLEQT